MSKDLDGKVAIVTGAGRNIGRAIALSLANAGAAIAVVTRSNKLEADQVADEITKSGGKALAVLADVADTKSVHAMADAAKSKFGRIDILVNNAALRDEKSIDAMTYADWRKIMDVTLDGAFHCVKACLPAIRAAGGGAIVNIGGMSAHLGSASRAHVTAAKLGLVGFTRGLAHDLAGDKISVNCVVPGAIGTRRAAAAATPAHHLTHGTITGERGKPEDVAAAVRYLCSPAAGFVTGQVLHVNGGAYLGS
ncbi:MAG: SDR family oxidoreductase [Pseudolabrys sp.]|nr:SDR family oxidoreductase [Pseudolabrys sp.]